MKLKVEDINHYYGKKCAINNLSMELDSGIYGLLGPNGAGKTTLMNILVQNMKPTEGRVLLDDNEIISLGKTYRKKVGYMPQQQNLYSYFTGYQFLSYMAALKGMDPKRATERINRVVKEVNLEEQIRRKIRTYSGGMKQRLLIAQAIMDTPEILIMDEPTAGLDPKERIRIRNLIAQIAKDKIVIIATHVVQDIEFIAKEIIMIKKGKLIEKAKSEELLLKMSGKVFEIRCAEEQVSTLLQLFLVSNISREGRQVKVRILSDTPPEGYVYENMMATLEDCYLYEFDDESGYC